MEKQTVDQTEAVSQTETDQEILNKVTEQICSFYQISDTIRKRVAALPTLRLNHHEAVQRLELQENIKPPRDLPEGELFDAIAQALGTNREEIKEKRFQNRMQELNNVCGYYYHGKAGPELVILEKTDLSTDHVLGHEVIHAIRGEIVSDRDQDGSGDADLLKDSDEKEGIVEGLRLLSVYPEDLEKPEDFVELVKKIRSREIEVSYPGEVIRFIIVLGATFAGDNPLSAQEAAKTHFDDGDTMLLMQLASRSPDSIKKEVANLLMQIK